MTIVETTRPVTGGVVTHLDTHVAAAVDANGGVPGVDSFPTTPAAFVQLHDWLLSFGTVDRVWVEGTGALRCRAGPLSARLGRRGDRGRRQHATARSTPCARGAASLRRAPRSRPLAVDRRSTAPSYSRRAEASNSMGSSLAKRRRPCRSAAPYSQDAQNSRLGRSATTARGRAGDRFEALHVVAVTTGMRQGELLALRWRDVRLDERVVHVRGTLRQQESAGLTIGERKTGRSRRQVHLSDVCCEACELTECAKRASDSALGRTGTTTTSSSATSSGDQ